MGEMKQENISKLCTYQGSTNIVRNAVFSSSMQWIDFGKGCEKKIANIEELCFDKDIVDEYLIFGNLDYHLINPDERVK